MSKVFTIAEGLQNLGALRSGGQGSVYRAKNDKGTIVAVKMLPTSVFVQDESDKNYRSFINEVKKLQKVNSEPHSNIVKILGYGFSESGAHPFIEMEFIEGPDLEELLRPPYEHIFTIEETIKLAVQLSNALAHCHRLDVKHGDIKSNNIRFNENTQNYVLLDFGLAAMSNEQRRTSLCHAGAIEFMAPETIKEGQLLFQTDVYGFGVTLFELLAGQVPFPLYGETIFAKNQVSVAHLEKMPPDLKELRRRHLPDNWSNEKKHHEMQIPEWLIFLLEKCLQKKPEQRFANGKELNEYIVAESIKNYSYEAFKSVLSKDDDKFGWEFLAKRLLNENKDLKESKKILEDGLKEAGSDIAHLKMKLKALKVICMVLSGLPLLAILGMHLSIISIKGKNVFVGPLLFLSLLNLIVIMSWIKIKYKLKNLFKREGLSKQSKRSPVFMNVIKS